LPTLSLSSCGFGQVDSAANAFLDEFAHRNTSINGQLVAINWDTWQVGMAVNTAVPDELKSGERGKILSTEAVDAFSRI